VALNRIRNTASATVGGAFFEDDINDIEEVLSLANSLRSPNRGTASEDDTTASLMSRLNQVRRPRSPTPIIRRSVSPVTYYVPQNTIPAPAMFRGPTFSPPSQRGRLAPESDAPQRRCTHGQRGQGGTRVAWCSLYFQFQDTFRAQLSLCLISRHDLLTCLLHSDLNVTSDVTTSRVLFPSKADDKYLQHMYVW
jgi:hypothetical protein